LIFIAPQIDIYLAGPEALFAHFSFFYEKNYGDLEKNKANLQHLFVKYYLEQTKN